MMRIGLYNVDSKLPNLALMKISAWHKSQGDDVSWCDSPIEAMTFDKVYGSQIFTDSVRWDAPNLEMGGSGYDKTKKLPQEIDNMKPDYSIYPDYKDSIGFTTRGCIRKCGFCFVPEMEGNIHEYTSVDNVWRGSGNLILMDNNILAMGHNHFRKVLEFAKHNKIKVDFNQGLDCRLVDSGIADIIIKYRSVIRPQVRFAFDNLSYEKQVKETCRLLGIRCFWYVYCDEDYESALERLLILKRLKQTPYLMRNKSLRGQQKFIWLAKWVNSMGAFKKMDIWDLADRKFNGRVWCNR